VPEGMVWRRLFRLLKRQGWGRLEVDHHGGLRAQRRHAGVALRGELLVLEMGAVIDDVLLQDLTPKACANYLYCNGLGLS